MSIFTPNQAKKLRMPNTIDLKEQYCKEYLNTKWYFKNWILDYIAVAWIIWFIIIVIIGLFQPKISFANDDIQDKIRLERLSICQKAYKESEIREQFIYKQIPAVRCATYMTLIYSYESNFWKSNMCKQQKNCWWIKGNWYDTPKWFLAFKTYEEWKQYFAKKYWKFHYKKDINSFVNSRSMTDRENYKLFMRKNYWNIYKELEYLYLTNKD